MYHEWRKTADNSHTAVFRDGKRDLPMSQGEGIAFRQMGWFLRPGIFVGGNPLCHLVAHPIVQTREQIQALCFIQCYLLSTCNVPHPVLGIRK